MSLCTTETVAGRLPENLPKISDPRTTAVWILARVNFRFESEEPNTCFVTENFNGAT